MSQFDFWLTGRAGARFRLSMCDRVAGVVGDRRSEAPVVHLQTPQQHPAHASSSVSRGGAGAPYSLSRLRSIPARPASISSPDSVKRPIIGSPLGLNVPANPIIIVRGGVTELAFVLHASGRGRCLRIG